MYFATLVVKLLNVKTCIDNMGFISRVIKFYIENIVNVRTLAIAKNEVDSRLKDHLPDTFVGIKKSVILMHSR